MNLANIKNRAQQIMGDRLSHPYRERGYIYHHGQRVGRIAIRLRELIFPGEAQHDQIILVGSWFHDVAKGIEPHWEYGALIVQKELSEFCTPAQLDKIAEIVEGHTLRKEKAYPNYVKLVQDADILDHFGSQEIWLNFSHAVLTGGGMAESLKFYEQLYPGRVGELRNLLNYEKSVDFFDERDRFVRDFIKRFRLESRGELVEKREKAKK